MLKVIFYYIVCLGVMVFTRSLFFMDALNFSVSQMRIHLFKKEREEGGALLISNSLH